MVLCLIALPIFVILGIFSIKYRKLSKESLDCLIRTATFRKCRSGLDDRIRAHVSGTILKYSPPLAKFTYKHYKILSLIFVILLVWSAYVSAIGTYNYVKYGNCNGPEETGFCVFDPTGEYSGTSEIDSILPLEPACPHVHENDPIIGPANAELTIIEFGCYTCPYTGKAEPVIQEVIDYYEGRVNFQFKAFVIPSHAYSKESALAANCAQEQGKYIEYHNALFSVSKFEEESFEKLAEQLGLNIQEFKTCMKEDKTRHEVEHDSKEGFDAGVHGTPTFFIKTQKIVGPKPFRTFKTIIDEELQ